MSGIELFEEQNKFIDALKSTGKSVNTVKNYKTDLNCFNKFLLSNKPHLKINEISTTEAQEYSRFLIQKYSSPNSIRRRVQALRIFFDFLIEHNEIDHNPIKSVVVAPKLIEAPKPANFQDIQKVNDFLLQKIEETTDLERLLALRNKLIFHLIYQAALKVSDLSRLSRESILLAEEGTYRVLIVPPRRDPITIPLGQNFAKYYLLYNEALEQQKNKDNLSFNKLFFNSNPYTILAGGISPRGIEILFKDLSQKTKTKLTARSLRQACIVKWLNESRPSALIKEWMGVQPVYSLAAYEKLATDHHYLDLP